MEAEAGSRSCDLSVAALFQAAQCVLNIPRGTNKINFSFFRGEGSSQRAQCISMESLVFCWLQLCFEPPPNFLQPGSGLGKYSCGSLWHREAELCPTAFALGFIAQYFLIFFFFCNLAWFTAIFPMPGRHNMIFHTSWRGTSGRRQAGSWEPSSLTCGWRWQALASATVPRFSKLSRQRELCFPCRLCTEEAWGG